MSFELNLFLVPSVTCLCVVHVHPPIPALAHTLSTMVTEVLVALVIGGLIFFLVQRSRTQVLKTEDGWWGAGAPPNGGEDNTIHAFKVTTSDDELKVSFPLLVCRCSWSLCHINS